MLTNDIVSFDQMGPELLIGGIFVDSALNQCCYPPSEQSRRDGSDEGSQHIVSMRKKNNHQILLII